MSGDAAERFAAIYDVVRRIPEGTVATYGQVAELAGMPGAARLAGAAMRACPPTLGLPWHRVVGKRSRTTARIAIEDATGAGVQRSILQSEGVDVSEAGSIALARFGWLPLED